MQLTKSKEVLDVKEIEKILIRENKYVTDLFSSLCMPQRNDEIDDEEPQRSEKHRLPQFSYSQPRAKSLVELQERLKVITSKKKLSYKEKLAKKSIKSRMKKKSKQDERNAQQKLLRAQKAMKPKEESKSEEPEHPISNKEGKMVFSKFDFSGLGPKKHRKQEKDPKKLLESIESQREKINKLTESGELEKAVEIKEKVAWKNALAKADGQKVKDDPVLLKKTMQRKEQQQRSSKKKWQAREEQVKRTKEERQKKRSENIQKRKKEKKTTKLKKAAKKGKIIPGF